MASSTDSLQVGIDLVNIQVPLKFVDDSVARRVEWVHANLLVGIYLSPSTDFTKVSSVTTRLPFEDDEFDHARICSIGRGVPENKVSSLHPVRYIEFHNSRFT